MEKLLFLGLIVLNCMLVSCATKQTTMCEGTSICYVRISNSDIPQNCDRLSVIPTTSTAMDRIGNK